MRNKKIIYLLLSVAVIFFISVFLLFTQKSNSFSAQENDDGIISEEIDDIFSESEEENQDISDEEALAVEINADETISNNFNLIGLTAESDAGLIETEKIINQLQPENCEYHLVTKVYDGDTVGLANGEKVRYIGIDTPETVHPSKPVQCFGREASAKNKELVLSQTVCLTKDITDRDKYGRLLRYIWLDGSFINLELVRRGYATSYTYPPDIKYQHLFIEAQDQAREEESGLWSACSDGEPLDWEDECLIKGNISTGGKIYHLPGCDSYEKTVIDESVGERWFCTEAEAFDAGWRKALNCN